jgi:WD40 repeat protein
VISASFSSDGARIVTVSDDRTARVWDTSTGQPLTPPLQHDAPIIAAAFTADGARMITVDAHAMRGWDVSLDMRTVQDWSNIADRGPFVVKNGVLVLRSVASRAERTGPARPRRPPS